jgi:hypothetical protein
MGMSVWQKPLRHICSRTFNGERPMRFMVIVHANKDTEAGVMPTAEQLTAMGKFNEEMCNAGVMQAGEGLHPTMKGARITFTGSEPTVAQGPFDVTRDLVAGFWLIDVASKDEAITWMKRAPFAAGDEIEIRQVFAPEDFGDALTPEVQELAERLRAKAAKK